MMSLQKYIHIGYNKCFSTSLQTGFFASHKELYHLGIGYAGEKLGYVDTKIEHAVEQHLRFSKDFIYQDEKRRLIDCFSKQFLSAEQAGKTYAGISSEHLSFNLTPDNIDITTKAERLAEIFGPETKIIMIIRNQIDFFRSMYREAVRGGYHLPYANYIDYIYKFQARNFVSDYRYDQIYKLYARLFGPRNIKIILMEEVRDQISKRLIAEPDGILLLTKKITDFLGISTFTGILDHANPALPDYVINILRQENAKNPHGLSNTLYDSEQTHRLRSYFEEELDCTPPTADDDWKKKWGNINIAQKAYKNSSEAADYTLDYRCDPILLRRITNYYADSNEQLQQILGIDLSQYGYPTKLSSN